MRTVHPRRTRAVASAILLVLVSLLCTHVHAQPLTYLVGADTAVCDFDDIQSAIDAAQNHAGPDRIRIAHDQTYAGLALKVGAQDLTIEGGYASCAEALSSTVPPSARTTLSGAGAPQDSVMEISGAGVRSLRGLTLRDGDDPVSGGGLQFNGAGELYLERVSLTGNRSAFGAGINFHGPGSAASLIFVDGVLVQNNTASESGGGIRVTGNATLFLSSDRSAVVNNEAQGQSSDQQGHGGGVLVVGPAQAHIAAGGVLDQGAIYGNAAKYGGGIAVIGSEDGSATAFLYTVDPSNPLWINSNRASIAGGGVYTDRYQNLSQSATVYAWDIRIENNRAPDGAALEIRSGSDFYLNAVGAGLPTRPGVASDCAPATPCNRIRANRAESIGGGATQGVVMRAPTRLQRVSLLDNAGGGLVQGVQRLDTALIAGNVVSNELFLGLGFIEMQFDNLTLADNLVGADTLIDSFVPPVLTRSIVHQPGKLVSSSSFGLLRDVLVSDCSLLACSEAERVLAFAGEPGFVDPQAGDYHLHPGSAAVDFAPAVPGSDSDLDGAPYDVDLVRISNRFGERDLGAFELQSVGNLVRNGHFADDTRFWTAGANATLMRDATGGDSPGSLRVVDTGSPAANEVVARQCIALPAPGRYQIHGMAHGEGLLSASRDRVSIRWRYLVSSPGEGCDGTPALSGEMLFPNLAGFGEPMHLPDGAFTLFEITDHSKVEIELVVTEGSNGVLDSTAGYFDGIGVFLEGPPDAIFGNGFEIGS